MTAITTTAIALLLMPSAAGAEMNSDEFYRPKLSGYYKNLFTTSETLSTDEIFVSDLNRIRVKYDQRVTKRISIYAAYDNEVLLNTFYDTPDFDLIREKNQADLAFWDMDKVAIDRDGFYWRHSLYRAIVKYYSPKFQTVVGKQAIDWSRMRFYHPFDLFNPISPLDIEQKEKMGVDAANVTYSPTPFSYIDLIYAPGWTRKDHTFGARVGTKIHDYDIFFIGAQQRKDNVIGAGFDGYVKDAGFRGEYMFTFENNGHTYLRGSVGVDYSFNPRLYWLAEYFYNGDAKIDERQRFLGSLEISRRAMSLTKHIAGTGVEYRLSGVAKLNNYVFYDFEGESAFYNPEFQWNIRPNFDLSCGAQVFGGDNESEYGNFHHLFYAELKYSF